MDAKAVYCCVTKRCRAYRVEFQGVPPAAFRQATGSHVRCHACGQAVRLVRIEAAQEPRTEKAGC